MMSEAPMPAQCASWHGNTLVNAKVARALNARAVVVVSEPPTHACACAR